MSYSKQKTEVCGIQAKFEGGILDGQILWVDKPHPKRLQCKLEAPTGDEVAYSAACVYRLESEGTPLVYRAEK